MKSTPVPETQIVHYTNGECGCQMSATFAWLKIKGTDTYEWRPFRVSIQFDLFCDRKHEECLPLDSKS